MSAVTKGDFCLSEANSGSFSNAARGAPDPCFKRVQPGLTQKLVHGIRDEVVNISGCTGSLGELECGIKLTSTSVVRACLCPKIRLLSNPFDPARQE
jgi:hypothetical protein